MRDITERKKIDRMKNEFVSTVSHELRTPVGAMTVLVDALSMQEYQAGRLVQRGIGYALLDSVTVRALLHDGLTAEGFDLPRSLSLFVGNTAAAAEGLRHLLDQPDYNRVWPGCETAGTPEHDLMREVIVDELL